jgi:hypothetical protein
VTTLGDLRRMPLPDATPVVVAGRTSFIPVRATAEDARCVTCDVLAPRLCRLPLDPAALVYNGQPRGRVTVVRVEPYHELNPAKLSDADRDRLAELCREPAEGVATPGGAEPTTKGPARE